MYEVESRQNPHTFFSLAIRSQRVKKKKYSGHVSIIWHRRFFIENQESDGDSQLSECESERRSKRLREYILCLGDEVCIYHREKDIYDHLLKVGLPILKVQPVESKQPHFGKFFISNFSFPMYLKRKNCEWNIILAWHALSDAWLHACLYQPDGHILSCHGLSQTPAWQVAS